VALQNVAHLIKKCFRTEDVIARIGGDEIAVLLPGMNYEGILKSKERILSEVEKYNAKAGVKISLSVSVGCATCKEGAMLTETFKNADANMYEEKKRKKK
jgi:diguanylate cyclase (GGDEF)-like protein